MVPSETKNFMFCKRPSLRGSKGEEHYVPSETHSFEMMQKALFLSWFLFNDRDDYHRFLRFQLEGKFPTRFNRNAFTSDGLYQEMCIRLMKY